MKTRIAVSLIRRYWKPICVIALIGAIIQVFFINAILSSAVTIISAPFTYFSNSDEENVTELRKEATEEYKAIGLKYGIHWPDMAAYDTIRTKGDLETINKKSIKETLEAFSYYVEVCSTVTDNEGNSKQSCHQERRFYSLEEVLTQGDYSQDEIEYARFISDNLLSIANNEQPNIPGGSVEIDPELIAKNQFIWPLPGVGRITSPFDHRINPVTGKAQFHKGIDISNGKIGIPIVATADGTVVTWNDDPSSTAGKWIKLQHANNYQSRYLHMSKLAITEKTDGAPTQVKKGQVIGYVGTTGRSTGPHLHFEILKNGEAINPITLIEKSRPK